MITSRLKGSKYENGVITVASPSIRTITGSKWEVGGGVEVR